MVEARASFQPVSPRRTFQDILVQLEREIAGGRLRAGDQLPSERELAEQFDVSRASVREALRVLETLGVLRSQRGPGRGPTLVAEPSAGFDELLRFYVALKHTNVEQVSDMLVLIQGWAARNAALEAGAETVKDLTELVESMERQATTQQEFERLDATFHSGIVDAAGNQVAHLIFAGCRSYLERFITTAIREVDEWSSMRETLASEHRQVLEAIAGNDPDRAEKLAKEHVHVWCRRAIAHSTARPAD